MVSTEFGVVEKLLIMVVAEVNHQIHKHYFSVSLNI